MRNLAIQIPRALGPPVARALIDSCGRTRSAEPAITAILSGKWLTLFRHLPSCKLTNIDPENSLVLMETNLPGSMLIYQRVKHVPCISRIGSEDVGFPRNAS